MLAAVPEYVDLLESLRRGANVCYDSPRALLLEQEGVYMMAATDDAAALEALAHLPARVDLVAVHNRVALPYLARRHGLVHGGCCVQVMYDRPELMPSAGVLDVAHPRPYDWEAVRTHYDLVEPDQLYEHFCSEDFFCGYYQGQLAGFAGLHYEGSMGMLYVFPEFRHRGFGQELVAHTVNRQIALGRYAYAHVFADNVVSIALQRKMGMTFARGNVWWLWRKEEDALPSSHGED